MSCGWRLTHFVYTVEFEQGPKATAWQEVGAKVEKLSKTAIKDLERDLRILLGDDTDAPSRTNGQ